MSTRVLTVFGTRPEAIKLVPVLRELSLSDFFESRVCVTAQHREMLDPILSWFSIHPDFDIDLMRPKQDLTDITCRVLEGMRGILSKERPDWVVVQGDTTTAFAVSLAAFYEKIRVAHIEAGLRTGDFSAPWPEEMNRCLTSRLSGLHFAPTEHCRRALFKEGIDSQSIFVTGNTVIDTLLAVSEKIDADATLKESLNEQFSFLNSDKRLILVTGHRRESFGPGLERVCRALKRLSQRNDVEIVYPVHLNPEVRDPVFGILGNRKSIHLLEPAEYVAFVYLMKRSRIIITDSGGIQEEAPSLGKPVLVTREITERPEGVEAGTARLVGTDPDRILDAAEQLLDDESAYRNVALSHNPYGDGGSARRIVEILRRSASVILVAHSFFRFCAIACA